MNIAGYKKQIKEVCQQYEVSRLSIFGSALTNRFSDTSDIDMLVVFRNRRTKGSFDRYFSLKEELEAMFGRPVDLVCENQIRNPYFKNAIDQAKQVLYAT
ncbi:MAG: nucleotidyltransferase [Proteobacteria bacterium]|nr:nucleotidyltransferase [Pseudomonadota bacterium]